MVYTPPRQLFLHFVICIFTGLSGKSRLRALWWPKWEGKSQSHRIKSSAKCPLWNVDIPRYSWIWSLMFSEASTTHNLEKHFLPDFPVNRKWTFSQKNRSGIGGWWNVDWILKLWGFWCSQRFFNLIYPCKWKITVFFCFWFGNLDMCSLMAKLRRKFSLSCHKK